MSSDIKDRLGNKLLVGDTVAFGRRQGSRALIQTAEIVGTSVSPLGVFLALRTAGNRETSKTPEEIVKVVSAKGKK